MSGFPIRQVQGQLGAEESAFVPMNTASDVLEERRNPHNPKLIVRESSQSSTWIIAPSTILLRSASKTIAPIAAELPSRDKH